MEYHNETKLRFSHTVKFIMFFWCELEIRNKHQRLNFEKMKNVLHF